MLNRKKYDAVVVGSGPNGLAAAVTLAKKKLSVLVIEANDSIGGGARSAELTLPGFTHDTCSAVHPLARVSPFFRSLPLEKYGLNWIHPPVAAAHPFDDGSAACLYPSISQTIKTLGKDEAAYQKLMSPFVAKADILFAELLRPIHFPKHPCLALRFGWNAMQSAKALVDHCFKEKEARGLFAGLAAHSFLSLSQKPSAAIGLTLAIAGHFVGWPIPQGGSQKISDALGSYFKELGGEIELSHRVRSFQDIPEARAVLFDTSPSQFVKIAGHNFPDRNRRKFEALRLGPGVFKMDWALSSPIPWKAKECLKAGTVHLGGTFEELAKSEHESSHGMVPDSPFVLLSQPSLFDPTRSPQNKHTVWAYCHVPRASTINMSEKIETQIERFAPGFRDLILAKKLTFPSDLEAHNPNFSGGDISGGIPDLWQIIFRPTVSLRPYRTKIKNWFLCSASAPPGAGVHGMCGYYAAQTVLKSVF